MSWTPTPVQKLVKIRKAFRLQACVTLRTKNLLVFLVFFLGGGFLQLATAKGPGRILTLWQCAAKVILAFLMFAVLVLRVNECRPYTPF